MFMRYVGGGIGHSNQHSRITDSDTMDIDTAHGDDAAHDDDAHVTAGDVQQVHQLEQLAQDAIRGHAEHQVESDNAEQATDDEGSSDTCSGWDSDVDADSLKSDDSDMGPEDEEGFDHDGDDGYGSL